MSQFRVTVYREWKETGEVTIEADDEEEARDQARELLSSDNDAFEWQGSNMEIQNQDVECVEEVD